jgi:hypothetical protein
MEDNSNFKATVAPALGGVYGKNMILMPYAKNINYEDGILSICLDLVNNTTETEVGLKIKLSDDLIDLMDNLLYGEEE